MKRNCGITAAVGPWMDRVLQDLYSQSYTDYRGG